MIRRPAKYANLGPLMLAKLTVKFEGVDDTEFLAVQDAVEHLTSIEREIYLDYYRQCMRQYIMRHHR